MAITRRQFVTTLGALAAAMGVGQADISKITEAFAHGSPWDTGGWANKPKVVWVHGAECTGCSTSLLSLFEDVRGTAIEGMGLSTLDALGAIVGGNAKVLGSDGDATHPYGHRTLVNSAPVTGCDFDGVANASPYIANIADVLIDFIDLQYHETVMGMGGDLAYQWLADNMYNGSSTPFVLVVEGAVQDKSLGGYWNVTGDAKWCSIGVDDAGAAGRSWQGKANGSQPANSLGEHSFDDVVAFLAKQASCAAIVAIGQCACYGGYPACESPQLKLGAVGGANMTGAQGVKDFLSTRVGADKVINVPGCPANPWWFVLTVVAWLADFVAGGTLLNIVYADGKPKPAAVDSMGRLKAVFSTPIHGPNCPRYQDYLNGKFCTHPGTAPDGAVAGGCLQLLGCKGPSAKGLCNVHGWNSQQPRNNSSLEFGLSSFVAGSGTACPMAGAPCMACTEKGYPDAFVPFVAR